MYVLVTCDEWWSIAVTKTELMASFITMSKASMICDYADGSSVRDLIDDVRVTTIVIIGLVARWSYLKIWVHDADGLLHDRDLIRHAARDPGDGACAPRSRHVYPCNGSHWCLRALVFVVTVLCLLLLHKHLAPALL